MYKIKEAIIVEGTYDQIKLSNFLDAIIIKTNDCILQQFEDFFNNYLVNKIKNISLN